MATNIYWDGATATYAGPVAPSLPTPFWLDNSINPYVLNYWLDAPDSQYVPLGEIDPIANTFTPLGAHAAPTPLTISDNGDGTYSFTPPNGGTVVTIREFDIDRLPDSSVWATGDTLAKENAAGFEQEADADAFIADVLQSGPQSSAVLSALSTGSASVEEISVGTSLPVSSNEGDIAWLEIGNIPNRSYAEQIYLNGAWQATSRSFDEASMAFTSPATQAQTIPKEITVVANLPASASGGDIAWLETGTTPNRSYTEQIFLNGSWQATGRSFDEATMAFVVPATPSSSSSTAGPVAVFYQQEARSVTGGDLPGGGWRDRVLNTQQFNGITGLSLNAVTGEISFAAGALARNFWIRGRAALGFYYYPQGFVAVHHQTRIATSGGIQQIIGESAFGSNQDGSSQSGNTTHACLEGVLTVPAGGGTYRFQHVNNWSFSSWDTKQGEAVGRGMDLVNMTLGGPEVYATLSLQEIG